MRNKYTPLFLKELEEQAKNMGLVELIEWSKTKGYIMSKDAMQRLLSRHGIRHKDYNPNLANASQTAPIGYEKPMPDDSGLIRIKTETGWTYKQRYLYEKHYGKIPKGYMVIFLDGDKTNYDIDNLFAVKTSDYLVARNKGLLSNNKEITKTALMYGEFYHKIKEKKRNE